MSETIGSLATMHPLAKLKLRAKGLTPQERILFGLFLSVAIAIAISFVYLGHSGWPGLHWDAALYGTPVINVATGKGWTFGSYGLQITQRPSLLYNFHGILHVFIYGVALRAGTWERYIYAQGIVNSITFVSYSLFYLFLLVKAYGIRAYCLTLALLMGSVAGVICIGLQGRPEQLAPLILLLPLAAILFISNPIYLATALGVALGLLTILSPLIGVFFATLVFFFFFGANASTPCGYIRLVSVTLGTALVVSAGLVWMLTPFSPVEWYSNVFAIGINAISFEGLLLRLRDSAWGYTLIAPAWNFLSLLLVLAGGTWLWRSKRSLVSMFLLTIAFVFFNEKMCDYSYTPFIPFGLALCLNSCSSSQPRLHSSCFDLKLLKLGALIVALSYLIILASYLAVNILVPYSELSPVAAQQRFANSEAGRELKSGSSAVGFPAVTWPSMVLLGDASSRYVSFNPTLDPSSDQSLQQYESKTGAMVNWFVYPQTRTKSSISPPDSIYIGKNHFVLNDNHWVTPVSVDFRLRPSHLTNRNNFAIYRRLE